MVFPPPPSRFEDSDSSRYLFRIKGNKDDVLAFLKTQGDVQKTEEGDNDTVCYYAVLNKDTDPAAPAKAVIEKGWDLYEMKKMREDLESVFLEAITRV